MTARSLTSEMAVTPRQRVRVRDSGRARFLIPTIYIVFLLLPIYWLINMSFKTTNEILDGFSFWRFFFKIFMPTIAAGIGVACFFCFMFSWVELLLAKTLTSVAAKPISALMTKTASTSGYQLGLLAAAGSLTLIPGAVVIYFVRNYIAKGFALGRV